MTRDSRTDLWAHAVEMALVVSILRQTDIPYEAIHSQSTQGQCSLDNEGLHLHQISIKAIVAGAHVVHTPSMVPSIKAFSGKAQQA